MTNGGRQKYFYLATAVRISYDKNHYRKENCGETLSTIKSIIKNMRNW